MVPHTYHAIEAWHSVFSSSTSGIFFFLQKKTICITFSLLINSHANDTFESERILKYEVYNLTIGVRIFSLLKRDTNSLSFSCHASQTHLKSNAINPLMRRWKSQNYFHYKATQLRIYLNMVINRTKI